MTGSYVNLIDARTGEEIEGVNFPRIQNVPRVGEVIHWWEDMLGENTTGARRDFLVQRVMHDWRCMRYPPYPPTYAETVVLFVVESFIRTTAKD